MPDRVQSVCKVVAVLAGLLFLATAQSSAAFASSCVLGSDIRATLAEPTRAEIAAEAAAVPNGTGRLFRIEREGLAPSHLFGTMHLADPRILDLPEPATAALDVAGGLVIESVDILDDQALAATFLSRPDLTIIEQGTRLDELVPPEQRLELASALDDAGVPLATVQTLQPWFVAVMLAMPPCEAARQGAGEAVLDVALAERAAEAGIPIAGLESGIEQLEALASLPQDVAVESLLATLALRARMADIFETMTVLYLAGDVAAITPTIERLAPAGSDEEASAAVYAAYEDRIIRVRNELMAERLRAQLIKGNRFVAVGALHLPGETGLVELLRSQGYRVTRAD